MKAKLFITGLALMATTAMVNAQTQGNGQGNGNGRCKGTTFVDENKNGVCDNFENRQATIKNKKGKGSGSCDGTGKRQGQGKGRRFVDANKNGVCDNAETQTKK